MIIIRGCVVSRDEYTRIYSQVSHYRHRGVTDAALIASNVVCDTKIVMGILAGELGSNHLFSRKGKK